PSGPLGKRGSGAIANLFEESDVSGVSVPPHEPQVRAIRPQADGADFDLFIPSNLLYVEGHFPNAPIVPGVALIDWAVKFASQHLNVSVETAQVFQVKFRRISLPGAPVTLSLRRTRKPDRLTFEYTSADRVLSSGIIHMDVG